MTPQQFKVPCPRAVIVDFLMSGEPAVLRSIAALAANGFVGVQMTFNAHSLWPSLSWLTVTAAQAPGAVAAITRTVLRVEPGAIRISDPDRPLPRTQMVPVARAASQRATRAPGSVASSTRVAA